MLRVTLIAIVFGIVFVQLVLRRFRSAPHGAAPPGPPRKWLLGNLLDLPKVRPWETYQAWCAQYGDVIYLELPSRPIIILGTVKAATALLNGRSNVYSGRARSVMRELISWSWSLPSMPYGSTWRITRRYFHEHFAGPVIRQYHPIQLKETRTLLARLADTPERAREHIRSLSGSAIMRVVYGPRTRAQMLEYVRLADEGLESARRMVVPGAFLAESLPFLKHVPGWMIGGGARRFADKHRPIVQKMRDKPFEEAKAAMVAGDYVPSIVHNLIRQLQGDNAGLTLEQDRLARNVAGVAYAGAAGANTSAVESFILAMALFPEVQKRGQAELDLHVGPSRLPDFGDLKSLTYVKAIVMETLRWLPSAPLGIPHGLTEDDEWNGYRIRKGTMVVPNLWAMLHDPEDYPEPHNFNPDRFIGSDGLIDTFVRDPRSIAFGFGRR
ncbi:hypothetical protein EUX98_g2917 [Antrodiella citrinella]|uniref:Cytochrome P450 n=1 Tax=Antrodiella citrinella TaxID=2447956 RepID=A0A4S4N0L8_9APHY|nr:hypothetical protein EUX98_g2917 [Antrodiella citrinella]